LLSKNQANYEFDVEKGIEIRRVPIPPANGYHSPEFPVIGDFCFLGGKRRDWARLPQSGMEYFGYDSLRVVMVSGSFSYFEFRSADRIASSDDDTASGVTSHLVTSIENLQCLSVDFVLLLNTKIHHVYSG